MTPTHAKTWTRMYFNCSCSVVHWQHKEAKSSVWPMYSNYLAQQIRTPEEKLKLPEFETDWEGWQHCHGVVIN